MEGKEKADILDYIKQQPIINYTRKHKKKKVRKFRCPDRAINQWNNLAEKVICAGSVVFTALRENMTMWIKRLDKQACSIL